MDRLSLYCVHVLKIYFYEYITDKEHLTTAEGKLVIIN